MRLALIYGLLVTVLVATPGCKREAKIKSIRGDEITVPGRFEIRPRFSLPGFAGDQSGAELLLTVPDDELKLDLALNPMVHLYDRHFQYGVTFPKGDRWRQVPIGDELIRYVSLDEASLSDVVVEPKGREVVADCPVAMRDNPLPICQVAPFELGGFEVELSIADSDLSRYKEINSAVAKWLSQHHRAVSNPN